MVYICVIHVLCCTYVLVKDESPPNTSYFFFVWGLAAHEARISYSLLVVRDVCVIAVTTIRQARGLRVWAGNSFIFMCGRKTSWNFNNSMGYWACVWSHIRLSLYYRMLVAYTHTHIYLPAKVPSRDIAAIAIATEWSPSAVVGCNACLLVYVINAHVRSRKKRSTHTEWMWVDLKIINFEHARKEFSRVQPERVN